jgi:hypothetical protein
MTDAGEVERLQARVAELEAQLAERPSSAEQPTDRPPGRSVAAGILITLACVLAPLSVTAVWASTQVSDADSYVETVAPLADDAAIQASVADAVTEAIMANLDVESLTSEALQTLANQENLPPRVADALPSLAVPLSNGVESFTRDQVGNVIASAAFSELWAEVNRAAHTQVVALLEGNQGGAISAQDNAVTLNLGPVVAQVKQELVRNGFTLAQNIPTVNQSFVIAQSDAIGPTQGLYRLLNTLGFWLPLVVLALLVGGVLLAHDRRRALLRGALGTTAAMVVLGVALAVARPVYLGALPGEVLSRPAAGSVFDTTIRFLRTGLRAVAVLGLVVALGAFLAGPSRAARGARGGFENGLASLRGRAQPAGYTPGPVSRWVGAHKNVLRLVVLLGAGALLMFWSRPTGWVVLGLALLALVVLAMVELAAPAGFPGGTADIASAPADGTPEPASGEPAGPGAAPGVGLSDDAADSDGAPALPRQVPRAAEPTDGPRAPTSSTPTSPD